MRKIYLVLLAAVLSYASSFGQKGSTQIGAGADVSIPTSDFGSYFKPGFGGYVKALFGVGKSGQVSFTGGYTNFNAAGEVPAAMSLAPLLIGYRANFNGFFVEPQIGYTIGTMKLDGGEDVGFMSESHGMFTWAAGIGYVFNNKVEAGARYQMASRGGINAGAFGLRLGYNFSLNGSKGK